MTIQITDRHSAPERDAICSVDRLYVTGFDRFASTTELSAHRSAADRYESLCSSLSAADASAAAHKIAIERLVDVDSIGALDACIFGRPTTAQRIAYLVGSSWAHSIARRANYDLDAPLIAARCYDILSDEISACH